MEEDSLYAVQQRGEQSDVEILIHWIANRCPCGLPLLYMIRVPK